MNKPNRGGYPFLSLLRVGGGGGGSDSGASTPTLSSTPPLTPVPYSPLSNLPPPTQHFHNGETPLLGTSTSNSGSTSATSTPNVFNGENGPTSPTNTSSNALAPRSASSQRTLHLFRESLAERLREQYQPVPLQDITLVETSSASSLTEVDGCNAFSAARRKLEPESAFLLTHTHLRQHEHAHLRHQYHQRNQDQESEHSSHSQQQRSTGLWWENILSSPLQLHSLQQPNIFGGTTEQNNKHNNSIGFGHMEDILKSLVLACVCTGSVLFDDSAIAEDSEDEERYLKILTQMIISYSLTPCESLIIDEKTEPNELAVFLATPVSQGHAYIPPSPSLLTDKPPSFLRTQHQQQQQPQPQPQVPPPPQQQQGRPRSNSSSTVTSETGSTSSAATQIRVGSSQQQQPPQPQQAESSQNANANANASISKPNLSPRTAAAKKEDQQQQQQQQQQVRRHGKSNSGEFEGRPPLFSPTQPLVKPFTAAARNSPMIGGGGYNVNVARSHGRTTTGADIHSGVTRTHHHATERQRGKVGKSNSLEIELADMSERIPTGRNDTTTSSGSTSTPRDGLNVFGGAGKQIVLIHRLDRANPRTLSTLIEAMIHKQVVIKGRTCQLSDTLMVMATAKDRTKLPQMLCDLFLLNTVVPRTILNQAIREPLYTQLDLEALRSSVNGVVLDLDVQQYIRDIIIACRQHPNVDLIPTNKALKMLTLTAKAYATIHFQNFVTPSHVVAVAPHVLTHRIKLHQTVLQVNGYRISSAHEFVMFLVDTIMPPS